MEEQKNQLSKEKDRNSEGAVKRMPSPGQTFKLMGTRFEVIKSSGLTFRARIIDEEG